MAGVKGMKGGGGKRVGSGRKPVSATVLEITGGHSRREAAALPAPIVGVPAAPLGLPADHVAVWEALAPHAAAARTLHAGTVAAFADLCEAITVKRMMLAQITTDGLMQTRLSTKMDESGGGEQVFESKAHPLISKWTALFARVDAGMARFRITADGKPVMGLEQPAANPLEKFLTRRG